MQTKTLGGRYIIVQHLGGGGFSQTYLAKDSHLPNNPPCVVKQLQPQVASLSTFQIAKRLFDTEAQVLYKLGDHDQIPRLLAHFEENQEFYLVQELIVGSDLSQEITVGCQWHEAEVIALLQDVLNVLAFVHQSNVIHRDIKPSNLIRRKQDGKIVLIDFGAVKQVSTQTLNPRSQASLMTIVGTMGYMPNEQQLGQPRFGSDFYALGITAIEALTGVAPSQFQTNPQTNEIIWHRNAQISHQLAAILDKMVSSHFSDRYHSANEILSDLQDLPPSAPAAVPTGLSEHSIPRSLHSKTPTKRIQQPGHSIQGSPLSNAPTKAVGFPNPPSLKPFAKQGFGKIGRIFIPLAIATGAMIGIPKLLPAIFTSTAQSSNAIDYFNQGKALYSLERHQAAIAAFDQAIAINPTDADAWNEKGKAFYYSEQTTEALEAFDQALKLNPNHYYAWVGRGIALRKLQRTAEEHTAYEKALSTNEALLQANPSDAQAWYGKGLVLTQLEQYEAALTALDKATDINADNAEVWNAKGYIFSRLKQYEDAIAAYDRALQINPNDLESLTNRGTILTLLNRNEEALTCYRKVTEINPNYYLPWYTQGTVLYRLNRLKDALDSYGKSLKINPSFHLAWLNQGKALYGLSRYQEALKSYDKALQINPKYPETWLMQGKALEALQRYSDALTSYESALKLQPDDSLAIERRDQVRHRLEQ